MINTFLFSYTIVIQLSIYIYIYCIYMPIIYHIYNTVYILPKKKAQVLRRYRISDTHSNVSHFTNTQNPRPTWVRRGQKSPKAPLAPPAFCSIKVPGGNKKWEETNHPIFGQKKSSTIFSHLILYVKVYCFKLSLEKVESLSLVKSFHKMGLMDFNVQWRYLPNAAPRSPPKGLEGNTQGCP